MTWTAYGTDGPTHGRPSLLCDKVPQYIAVVNVKDAQKLGSLPHLLGLLVVLHGREEIRRRANGRGVSWRRGYGSSGDATRSWKY